MNIILPSAQKSCLTSNVNINFTDNLGNWTPDSTFYPGQWPQVRDVRAPDQGEWVIVITWSAKNDPGVQTQNSEMFGVFYDSLAVVPHYYCEVKFKETTITISQ